MRGSIHTTRGKKGITERKSPPKGSNRRTKHAEIVSHKMPANRGESSIIWFFPAGGFQTEKGEVKKGPARNPRRPCKRGMANRLGGSRAGHAEPLKAGRGRKSGERNVLAVGLNERGEKHRRGPVQFWWEQDGIGWEGEG